ncbi:MAG: hypothetical protein V3S12_01085, partial [Acidiferrobacterales bacterium]
SIMIYYRCDLCGKEQELRAQRQFRLPLEIAANYKAIKHICKQCHDCVDAKVQEIYDKAKIEATKAMESTARGIAQKAGLDCKWPVGMWYHNGGWCSNPCAHMTHDEQVAHNIKHGYAMNEAPVYHVDTEGYDCKRCRDTGRVTKKGADPTAGYCDHCELGTKAKERAARRYCGEITNMAYEHLVRVSSKKWNVDACVVCDVFQRLGRKLARTIMAIITMCGKRS